MDLAKLQEKKLKKSGIIIRYDDNGSAFVSVPVGQVPINQFQEWQERCDREFLGNRWNCIWTDYLRQKTFDAQAEAEALRQELAQPKEEEQESNPLGLLNG